jgi:3-oxoacyl-[acyl-carrier protein] reductase
VTESNTSGFASLQGKTALITGSASGMGRAGARLFAAQGAHVILADRNGEGAKAVADEITGKGGSAESYGVELSDQAALEAFVGSVTAKHDVLDVFWNQAGITGPVGLDYDLASWTEALIVNTWVPMYLTQQLLPLLRKSSGASIICTASTAGLSGVGLLPTYAVSKGALIQFVRSAALNLAGEGIRINAICPGATDTASMRRDVEIGIVQGTMEQVAAYVPMKRMGQPEDIANTALFLASDASSYITGIWIPVDGGATA